MMLVELFVEKFYLYLQTLLFNPSKIIFLISLVLTLLILPMRVSCAYEAEDYLIVLSIICKSVYILYLGRLINSDLLNVSIEFYCNLLF